MASNSILAKMTVQIAGQTAQFLSSMDAANKKLDSFEKNIQRAGNVLSATFIAAKVYEGLEYGVGVMKDFEKQIDTVAAISGAAGEDLKKLQDNAVNLAGAFRSIDIAKMETELARLGFQTPEIINSTKAIVDLATATGEDLAKSAEIVGSTLRIFQKEAEQSGEVAESMAIGFNTSALALDNFGEAIKYVGPIANAANLSLEQTTALLGVLADNGIKGSMAGTSLRKIISDLGQGAAPVLNQKLREMADAGLSGAAAMDEVGRTAYAALLILANNTDKIDAAVKAQNELKGTLEATSSVMQDNLQGDIDKLNASWDRMFISASGLIPVFRNLTKSATSFVNMVSGVTTAEEELYQFEQAVKRFNQSDPFSFGEEDALGLQHEIDVLKLAAEKAGRDVGFVWDETGKKIKYAFAITSSSGPIGPQIQGLPAPIQALTDPKTIRSVAFLNEEIKKLKEQIESSADPTLIRKLKADISGLQYEIDVLTGNVVKFKLEWDKAFDFDSLDLHQFDIFKRNPFEKFESFFDRYDNLMNPSKNNVNQDWLSFLMPNFDDEQEELQKSMEWFDKWKQQRIEGFEKTAHTAAVFGDALSDALASAIAGGENFARVLTRQIDKVVTELYRMAVAAQIAKAALPGSGYNPVKAIIGLTVGLVAIKAAFASIQKPRNQPSSSSSSGYGRGGDNLKVELAFQDSSGLGKYLKATIKETDWYDSFTKA